MNVEINDRHAVVETSFGQKKVVSIADLHHAIGEQLGVDETLRSFMLPQGVLEFKSSTRKVQLTCYYPECNRQIQFEKDGLIEEYSIPLPNVVITFELSSTDHNKYQLDNAKYFATNRSPAELLIPEEGIRRNPSQGIWVLPLPNMYDEGKMCFGKNSVQSAFSNNLRGLGYYYKVLTDSPFNSDLPIRELKSDHYRRPLDWIKALSKLEEFPYHMLQES